MPVIAGDVMGVKTVTFYPGNAGAWAAYAHGDDRAAAASTGEPLAVMDGRLITEMRTAAVSAAAFSGIAPLHFESAPHELWHYRLGRAGAGAH